MLALASFAYYAVALLASWRFFERGVPVGAVSDGSAPPLSLLKPIYGLDREAYENYASFCRQDYSDYEILFCVSDATDPAIPVIEKLIHDFPKQSIRLLVGSEPIGVSDKVNKLCRMAREAKHDLLVVTDSDVRVEPGFLRAVAAPFNRQDVAGVTCLYRGLTDGSLAANLEAVGNTTDFAAGVLVAWMFAPVNFMLGAVMATTKDYLGEIGGFEALADYFCDDYELGNRIAARAAQNRTRLVPGLDRLSASDARRSLPPSAPLESQHPFLAPARPSWPPLHAKFAARFRRRHSLAHNRARRRIPRHVPGAAFRPRLGRRHRWPA